MSIIIGDYKLYDVLGEGSTSKVKRAQSISTGKYYAMKIIKKSLLEENPMVNKQLKREIKILSRLHHNSIVQLHGIIESKINKYLILDYADGGNLCEKLKKAGYFDEDTSRYYFQLLIDAVSYIHSQNTFHRDLKLENLLLDSETGEIKIADFGLSVLAENSTEMLKTKCGTPCYTAPEIFMSSKYSGQPPDIWSCGVILYMMLTGKYPFEGSTINNLIQKIVKGKVIYTDSMPAGAIDLLKHIFVVDPKKRYTIEHIKRHPWFKKNYVAN